MCNSLSPVELQGANCSRGSLVGGNPEWKSGRRNAGNLLAASVHSSANQLKRRGTDAKAISESNQIPSVPVFPEFLD